MSDLILLRHGETAGESSIRFYGATDIALSEFGRNQMKRAGTVLHNTSFRTVITSPLRRARDSASIVLDGRSTPVTIIEDFREVNFGEWEGMTGEEIAERDPPKYRDWKEYGRLVQYPGGDVREEFFSRVGKAALEVFNSVEIPALAVLHKGVIRGVLNALLGIPLENMTHHPIELGSIHRLSKPDGSWVLTAENEIDHLGELRKEGS